MQTHKNKMLTQWTISPQLLTAFLISSILPVNANLPVNDIFFVRGQGQMFLYVYKIGFTGISGMR